METPELYAGRWVRFSEYVIRDGYIRPAAGASIEVYDPWRLYEQSRSAHRSDKSPHIDFLNLEQALPDDFYSSLPLLGLDKPTL